VADWFAPKRYGYGSGVPIAWQGWVVTLVYVAIVVGATQLLKNNGWAMGSAIVTATAIFLVIVIKNTRGGWRRRWGDTE
jgi:hypothetical protein